MKEVEQSLGACLIEDYSLLVTACPVGRLSDTDIACVHHFVARGGSLLVLAEAGGDAASGELRRPLTLVTQSRWSVPLTLDMKIKCIRYLKQQSQTL